MQRVQTWESSRESRTKEAKENSQDSGKRSPGSRALRRSHKPRIEVSIAFITVSLVIWARAVSQWAGEQKTAWGLRRQWKVRT